MLLLHHRVPAPQGFPPGPFRKACSLNARPRDRNARKLIFTTALLRVSLYSPHVGPLRYYHDKTHNHTRALRVTPTDNHIPRTGTTCCASMEDPTGAVSSALLQCGRTIHSSSRSLQLHSYVARCGPRSRRRYGCRIISVLSNYVAWQSAPMSSYYRPCY